MKKQILLFVCIFGLLLSGCTQDESGENAILEHLNEKYNDSFEFVSYLEGKYQGGSMSIVHAKDSENTFEVVRNFNENDEAIYNDSYIAELNSDKAKNLISNLFSEYYEDFSIDINMYKTFDYNGIDKDISIENYLADDNNGMRIMLYIKSDDSVEMQREKIKDFNANLKEKQIYLDCFYFAFFESDVELENIDEDYSYEYAIDGISKNDKYKNKITEEYYAYWIKKDNSYNYCVKLS